MKSLNLVFLILGFALKTFAAPTQPTDPTHPGSAAYAYEVQQTSFSESGRNVDVFLPKNPNNPSQKFPVLVFGHGQAIDLSGYQFSFIHLAKKGIAVVFPQYDTGFWDQSWRRMADDYNRLTQAAFRKFPQLDSSSIVFSGHSKGGYIGLMAAGAASSSPLPATSVLVFAPAGYDAEYLRNMNPNIPVTTVWGDQDSIVSQSSVRDIYDRSPAIKKQFIEAVSYPDLSADHFFVMTESSFFGGRKGASAFHWYGFWKWVRGAALGDDYLYGSETSATGQSDLSHKVIRNF